MISHRNDLADYIFLLVEARFYSLTSVAPVDIPLVAVWHFRMALGNG